jgi:hypothetical protein
LKVALNILTLTPVVAEIVSYGSLDIHLFMQSVHIIEQTVIKFAKQWTTKYVTYTIH